MFVVTIILSLLVVTHGVDRSNFKTCDQSGFCRRHRQHQPDATPYKLLLNTLKQTDSSITLVLENTKNNVQFVLEFTALKRQTSRLKIKEVDSSKRYEIPVGGALVNEPEQDVLKVAERNQQMLKLQVSDYQVVITSEPFRMDFIVDNTPVISVNSKKLLKLEHYRKKEAGAQQPDQEAQVVEGEGQEAINNQPKEEDEPDMWEETFKTNKDTKPNGPMSVGLDITFPGFQFLYGIPEHADTLALKTTKGTDPYRLYNLDVFEYELSNPMALYGSIPVLYAHNEKRTVGIFWHNAAETWIDISSNVADKGYFSKILDLVKGSDEIPQAETRWFSESGVLDVFFMLGPKPLDVFSQYTTLTGTLPLPPMFAIAYHQSRWNYNDQDDVASLDANFDKYDIPCDVYWLDIEHTDGKRYFTWDAHKFPNSKEMIDKVAAKNRKMVTIVDPHIKKDGGYRVYQDAKDRGYFIRNKDNDEYEGWCWPGSSAWPDFLNPDVRQWWAEQFQLDKYVGSTLDLFTWNDMNEPSVFNGPEITMHKDALHYGGFENRDVHNVYGFYVQMATYNGHLLRDPQQRPFVLSRAFFSGSQRYGAVWTGDNSADWSHLKISLPMVLSLSISGISFGGADIGGFFKNPDHDLLVRWYQAAAFQPFMRAHAHLDTRRREPWLLSDSNMKAIRHAIIVRYSYLPLWYTLFYQHEQTGSPVVRPLWVEFPDDSQTFPVEDEYMLGSSLLVHPVTDAGVSTVQVYFPGKHELWYDVYSYEVHSGDTRKHIPVTSTKFPLGPIPVYQRGGQIVSRRIRVRRSASIMVHDPITLVVALDRKGTATGQLYLDDLTSFKYKSGEYIYRQFTFEQNVLRSSDLHPSGSTFKTSTWLERVVILGLPNKPSMVTLKGSKDQQLDFTYENKVLTVRKPGCHINDNWSIVIR